MATIHHQPYHHSTTTATATSSTSRRPRRRHSLDYSSLPSSSSSSTTTLLSISSSVSGSGSGSGSGFGSGFATNVIASSTTTPTVSQGVQGAYSLDALEGFLAEQNFRQADEETRRLLIVLAGEAAVKRGYVFFSEVQFIPKDELKAVDDLWKRYSDGRFGYSVQKKIWLKVNKDFTRFFMKVSWMKKLDTEIEQFNYRSFPSEFIWELNPENNNSNEENNNSDGSESNNNSSKEVPPEGHLPLTNALRGTQLLNMIFTHPAFDEGDDEEKRNEEKKEGENGDEIVVEDVGKKKSRLASLRDRLFKPNYSF